MLLRVLSEDMSGCERRNEVRDRVSVIGKEDRERERAQFRARMEEC